MGVLVSLFFCGLAQLNLVLVSASGLQSSNIFKSSDARNTVAIYSLNIIVTAWGFYAAFYRKISQLRRFVITQLSVVFLFLYLSCFSNLSSHTIPAMIISGICSVYYYKYLKSLIAERERHQARPQV
jgi:membrane protease YdiL (CAAX protease family)